MRRAICVLLLAIMMTSTPAFARDAKQAACLNAVALMYAVTPAAVKLGKAKRDKKSGYALKGTVDKGPEGEKPFQCRFHRRGKFLHIMSLVDEGAL